jgi:hypothetical protein
VRTNVRIKANQAISKEVAVFALMANVAQDEGLLGKFIESLKQEDVERITGIFPRTYDELATSGALTGVASLSKLEARVKRAVPKGTMNFADFPVDESVPAFPNTPRRAIVRSLLCAQYIRGALYTHICLERFGSHYS